MSVTLVISETKERRDTCSTANENQSKPDIITYLVIAGDWMCRIASHGLVYRFDWPFCQAVLIAWQETKIRDEGASKKSQSKVWSDFYLQKHTLCVSIPDSTAGRPFGTCPNIFQKCIKQFHLTRKAHKCCSIMQPLLWIIVLPMYCLTKEKDDDTEMVFHSLFSLDRQLW